MMFPMRRRVGPGDHRDAADAAVYASDQRPGQSVVRVLPGEKLTERQALEALLIPSGNNIAAMLASWDAGTDGAFVAKMNAQAQIGQMGVMGHSILLRIRHLPLSG
jgi:D-alanyl-D-alanine carboxypeptidase